MFSKKNSKLFGIVMLPLAALMMAGTIIDNLQLLIQLKIVTILYAGAGMVSIIAYWPTIKDLVGGKPSANISTYLTWTMTAGIAFLYSLLMLSDVLVKIVSGLNFVACALVMLLSVNLKYKKQFQETVNMTLPHYIKEHLRN